MYRSVRRNAETLTVIEKSKFIARCGRVESKERAEAFVREISLKERDATHNCYAYSADTSGSLTRFSDDGEPSGTAGMPILNVIKSNNLVYTAVVVTRYFGGIKLGAGGLVRAYTEAAASAVNAAGVSEFIECVLVAFRMSYSLHSGFERAFEGVKYTLERISYSDDVLVEVAVPVSELNAFAARLEGFSLGEVEFRELSREFRASDDFVRGA